MGQYPFVDNLHWVADLLRSTDFCKYLSEKNENKRNDEAALGIVLSLRTIDQF